MEDGSDVAMFLCSFDVVMDGVVIRRDRLKRRCVRLG